MSNTSLTQFTHNRISELNSRETLLSSNLFLVSEFNKDNNLFSSKKCDFSQLSGTFIKNVEEYPAVTITNAWTFTNTLSAITIETTSITLPESVINEEYLSVNFSKIFNQLSADLFGRKFRLPSYIGQIIVSTTLKNEMTVQKYYGSNTRWQQLPGRFLLPVTPGDKPENTINKVSVSTAGVMAGSSQHEFTVKDLNMHSHDFVGGDGKKNLSMSFTYYPLSPGKRIVNVRPNNNFRIFSKISSQWSGSGINYEANVYTAEPQVLRFAGGWCSPWERGNVTTKYIYGPDKPKITISPIGAKFESKTFTKLPPFYSVYLWKRIS